MELDEDDDAFTITKKAFNVRYDFRKLGTKTSTVYMISIGTKIKLQKLHYCVSLGLGRIDRCIPLN